jgi:hypothetical protein
MRIAGVRHSPFLAILSARFVVPIRFLEIAGRILRDSGTRGAVQLSAYCFVGTRRFNPPRSIDALHQGRVSSGVPAKPSAFFDTRVVCGGSLTSLARQGFH